MGKVMAEGVSRGEGGWALRNRWVTGWKGKRQVLSTQEGRKEVERGGRTETRGLERQGGGEKELGIRAKTEGRDIGKGRGSGKREKCSKII